MKLYRVEYKFLEQDIVQRDFMDFVGENLFSILPQISNEMIESGDLEIISMSEIEIGGKSVNIVNYVEPDCNCAYCRAFKVPLDMIIKFNCPNCGDELRLAENGWELVGCTKCNADIYRHNLSRSKEDGKWYYTVDKEIDDEG